MTIQEPPRANLFTSTDALPTVPGYRLGRELGRGAMGVVFLATRESDGEEVAIKTLLPAIPPTRTALGRFVRESDVLRQLSHPNIVAFRVAGSAGPLLYFVMEFVPGTSAPSARGGDARSAPPRRRCWAGRGSSWTRSLTPTRRVTSTGT